MIAQLQMHNVNIVNHLCKVNYDSALHQIAVQLAAIKLIMLSQEIDRSLMV